MEDHVSRQRVSNGCNGRDRCTHVEVAHPLQDGGVILLGLAEQSGLLVLGLHSKSALTFDKCTSVAELDMCYGSGVWRHATKETYGN